MTDEGIVEMQALIKKTGTEVDSVCADYFMDWPLLKCDAAEHERRVEKLLFMLGQVKKLGARSLVLPFVDASAMDTAEEEAAFIALMNTRILPEAERLGIEIHLETSLPPEGVARVLAKIPSTWFWINYDSGNSASLGYAPADEFKAYGGRIGSFHIKDRVLGGTTVALGTGNTDFAALAKGLRDYRYDRNFVLQVARGEPGKEVAAARANRRYTEAHLFAKP